MATYTLALDVGSYSLNKRTPLITSGGLSSGSLTRSSTAEYWNSSGDLTSAAVDEARTDYDPSDNSLRGLLIEEARTNELLDNRDLSTGNWDAVGGLTVAKDAVGIDGVANAAHTVSDPDAGFTSRLYQDRTVANDTSTHALTFFIEKDNDETRFPVFQALLLGGTLVAHSIYFNTKTGATSLEDSASSANTLVEDAGNFWKITTAITNNNSGNTTLRYRIYPAIRDSLTGPSKDSLTGSIVYDYGGIELNANHATSPIETGSSTVTRAEDDATATIGTWPVPVSYEIIATPSGDQDGVIYQADDGTENNRIRFERISGNLHVIVTNGGTEQANIDLGALTDFTEFTVRAAFDTNDVAASLNGAAVVTDSSATIPTVLTTHRYGQDTAGEHWNAWIKNIDVYAQRLDNATLVSGGATFDPLDLGQLIMPMAQGSYTLSGQEVGLLRNLIMAFDQGSYALSGQSVALNRIFYQLLEQGSYTLSGQDLTFLSRWLSAVQASQSWSLQDGD